MRFFANIRIDINSFFAIHPFHVAGMVKSPSLSKMEYRETTQIIQRHVYR
jgi:hypothetical protein